jgi:transcriptional regulator
VKGRLRRIDEVIPLLEQGYTQAQVAELLGMWQGNVSFLLLRHGLRKARPSRNRLLPARVVRPTVEVRIRHSAGHESLYRDVTSEQLRKLADLLDA